jgi:hypothetical protein
MAVVAALLSYSLSGQTASGGAWQNVTRLAPGEKIEITDKKGETWKGTLASVSEDSIGLTRKQQTVPVARAEVARVRLRPKHHLKYTLLGAGIGAGGGAGLGAAAGEGLSNASGGDFSNLKPAIVAVSCGIGALTGALVGSLLGNRHTTVYKAK